MLHSADSHLGGDLNPAELKGTAIVTSGVSGPGDAPALAVPLSSSQEPSWASDVRVSPPEGALGLPSLQMGGCPLLREPWAHPPVVAGHAGWLRDGVAEVPIPQGRSREHSSQCGFPLIQVSCCWVGFIGR